MLDHRVLGSGFWVPGSGFRVHGNEWHCWIEGFKRTFSLEFGVWDVSFGFGILGVRDGGLNLLDQRGGVCDLIPRLDDPRKALQAQSVLVPPRSLFFSPSFARALSRSVSRSRALLLFLFLDWVRALLD